MGRRARCFDSLLLTPTGRLARCFDSLHLTPVGRRAITALSALLSTVFMGGMGGLPDHYRYKTFRPAHYRYKANRPEAGAVSGLAEGRLH